MPRSRTTTTTSKSQPSRSTRPRSQPSPAPTPTSTPARVHSPAPARTPVAPSMLGSIASTAAGVAIGQGISSMFFGRPAVQPEPAVQPRPDSTSSNPCIVYDERFRECLRSTGLLNQCQTPYDSLMKCRRDYNMQ